MTKPRPHVRCYRAARAVFILFLVEPFMLAQYTLSLLWHIVMFWADLLLTLRSGFTRLWRGVRAVFRPILSRLSLPSSDH